MAGRPTVWTDDLRARLRALLAQGLHDAAVATELGMRHTTVMKQRQREKLPPNRDPRMKKPDKTRTRWGLRDENEQPWEPLPGMIKHRCRRCSFWFAAPSVQVMDCPDCRIMIRATKLGLQS